MTSSTNHDEGPEYNPNINGDVLHVTQLAGKEKSRRQATKDQHPFIPPSDSTPVNNLPNELLSYIFTLGSENEKSGHDDDDQEEEEDVADEHGPHLPFQVLVSHICRRWRAVATETPTLWTYLDFEEGPPFEKSQTWLERSKECPLDIELDCTIDSDSDSESGSGSELDDEADPDNALVAPQDHVAMPGGPPPPLTPLGGHESKKKPSSHISPADLPVVRDLILPHSARWRVFELYVDDFQIMHGILSTLSSIPSAPELRALRLRHRDDNEDFDHFHPVHLKEPFFAPFCGRAPELGQVTLWGVHVDWETCAFLQGLQELELGYHAQDVRPPYAVFARILRGSPDLHTLTLAASGPAGSPSPSPGAGGDWPWPADVIELPSVRQLSLAFVEPAYASALLKRLVFPHLAVLELDFDPEDYTAFVEQQLARPPPGQRYSLCQNLVELKLAGMQCSDATPLTLYAALPNLVKLKLNCYHLQDQFFGALFVGTLPKLTTLTTCGISGVQMMHLLNLRPMIKHVQMDSTADVTKEEEAWLRAHTEFAFFDDSDDEDEDEELGVWIDNDDDDGQIE